MNYYNLGLHFNIKVLEGGVKTMSDTFISTNIILISNAGWWMK